MIDRLFHFDNKSPPMLLRDGELRLMVRAAFASMIMYHDARLVAGEMRVVLVAMHYAFNAVVGSGVAAQTFSEWGSIVRTQFDMDNLH